MRESCKQIGFIGSLRILPRLSLVFLCLSFFGCDDGPTFCTASSEPGISIRVLDAETGLPATCGLQGWLISGAYSEALEPRVNCSDPDSLQYPVVFGAYERAGVYSIILLKDGYQNWSRSGIVVEAGDCHVQKVSIEANLRRE